MPICAANSASWFGLFLSEQANVYLETEFIVWWNETIAVVPASSDDEHRPLGKEPSLASALSYVESRQVSSGYTIQVDNQT